MADPDEARPDPEQVLPMHPPDELVKDTPSAAKNKPENGGEKATGAAETVSEALPAIDAENGAPLEDPIEILVGLAERGEIDPWNINIIEVTDRFLSELERRRELNLKLSGRTLFYAATLLRMKSEHLLILASPDDKEDEDTQREDQERKFLHDAFSLISEFMVWHQTRESCRGGCRSTPGYCQPGL